MTCFQSLFSYELKKIFSNRPAVILMSLAAVLMLVLSSQRYIITSEKHHVPETKISPESRMMDDAFFDLIRFHCGDNNENEPENPWFPAIDYAKIVFRYDSTQSTESYDLWNADLFYKAREQGINENTENLYLTENEIRFWKEKEEFIAKPFIYQNTDAVRQIRKSYQFALTLTCLLIGIFLSGSFSSECEKRTDELIRSGKYGQKQTLTAKLIAGLIVSLMIGCLMLVSTHLPIFFFSDINGFDAPWYLVEPFSSISMKAGQMCLFHTLIFLLGCILMGLFSMFLSLCFRKTTAAMGTVFAIVIFDLFISVPAKMRIFSQIRYLTPLSVLMNTHAQDMRLIKLFGKYLITFQTGPILYALCGVTLTVLITLAFNQRFQQKE